MRGARIKLEVQDDNGNWNLAQTAEWIEGDCEDCADGQEQSVLIYKNGDNDFLCTVCQQHLQEDETLRLVTR